MRTRMLSVLGVIALVLSVVTPVLAGHKAGAPIIGQVPSYDATAAEEEGYWYSRYNLMSLSMQSGNGETFMPDMNLMMAMVQAVDANPNDGDTVMLPANPQLISVAYAGGDPHFIQPPSPMDFATLRWAGGDTRVTMEATAWTLVKELEWAKQFHVDSHFGTPADNFGAQGRFMGMVMALLPKMQFQAYLQNPARYTTSKAGDYALLIGLSDGIGVYGAAQLPNSASNRYFDPTTATMFSQVADQQFAKVIASNPHKVQDLSLGIQSLVWYAANTSNAANKALALSKIADWGRRLQHKQTENPTQLGSAIRGLIEVGRITGDTRFLDAAAARFNTLSADFNSTFGYFNDQKKYTIDDVGTLLGAINASRLFLGARIDQVQAAAVFAGFYEGTVNLSGLQISAPPVDQFKDPFEQAQPEINLRYPGLPFPADAGGAYGIAPVFAASVKFSAQGWKADQSNFDTAGAMHTANEMIWFHNDEVNGFPIVP